MDYTHDTFISPYTWRYGSSEMREVFSEVHKRKLLRRVWIALAKAEMRAGLVTESQLEELIASGVGQTSRVDALKQAIEKAHNFGFDLEGAVMASDAFFPFGDCVEIAGKEGVTAVIQPGGSIRDAESVDYCNAHGMAMVMTGIRHFKH